MDLKELIQIAGEQGKVIIIDDNGEVKGVFVAYDSNARNGKPEQSAEQKKDIDPEKINRAILEAQLQDEATPTPAVAVPEPDALIPPAERLDSLLSRRAQELFRSVPNKAERKVVDMRAEVIDPNYDFNAPEVSSEDENEIIRPNFDDI